MAPDQNPLQPDIPWPACESFGKNLGPKQYKLGKSG